MSLDKKLVNLPLLPLRDIVVFPHMVVPLFVGRARSIATLEKAMAEKDGHQVILTVQTSPEVDEPKFDQINKFGVVANILQLIKLPDGTIKVLVEGVERIKIDYIEDDGSLYMGEGHIVETTISDESQVSPLIRSVGTKFEEFVKINKRLQPDVVQSILRIEDPVRFSDTVCAQLHVNQSKKQSLLEKIDLIDRLNSLLFFLEYEMDIISLEKKIQDRVKKQMEKSQRDYYLNEQIKAIQKELGEGEEGADLELLEKKIKEAGMPDETEEKVLGELKKLKQMAPMSAEAAVIRSYIDAVVSVPWKKKSKANTKLSVAQETLDADHYGLEKVKERIVEYLAVQKRGNKLKAPILCLVGPPGVGKTSLGQSIAKATNRKYVRMALGGVHDESEIRGHRRTYIGAMPGKIIQNMTKVGVKNPLFLLDEIDKMGQDYRGDPSAALLEVLDPEQNNTFQDHYLEVDYDLSEVLFVATSNTMNIPAPLLDRMEVIRLSGYTEDEKLHIAKDHLIPKLMKNNGIKTGELEIDDTAVIDVVRYYTREAGVRSLERELGKICRKVVKAIVEKEEESSKKTKIKTTVVDSSNLDKYLGVRKFTFGLAEKENRIGQVTGLAWTEVGGDLLSIEVAVVQGKGQIQHTGSLGDVMKESMSVARTVIRSWAYQLGFFDNLFEKKDMHIHVPDGATPKDGPSAGIAVTTALVSAYSGIPVRADVAMTGEITLRGEVLAIGGLKEKLLAALRGGIKKVLIPQENVKDLAEIPENVKNGLEIIPVKWINEVLEHALVSMPKPLSEEQISKLKAEALNNESTSGSTPKSIN
ncbi:endopeptidase La [Taylorella equigenitalis]|uniref:endopeptidase La n=1 Tax=Taylorella equigenitalis TaxID=29575 RepID=UPI0023AF2EE4|nr:endopeptidase La [Taylorella equigenitalis]WEE00001.1 endopeptidase La [Taylorella equigenitalis]WEE01478.1 endopeptidase La [Taylorella equigenitalis]WFD78015.1 endopeptidase La [Taylorella equigenitalis]WFD79493.1 endopeptidase La [Taylorella equigenitalis]WFD80969.1 endopeptidase La [Taylorella equigenitalis]